MSLLRKRSKVNYTHIANDILEDTRLSSRAVGLAVRLLSKPDNWVIRIDALAREYKEGEKATRTAMRELTDLGYMRRERVNDEQGRVYTVTVLADFPAFADEGTPQERAYGYAPTTETDIPETDIPKTDRSVNRTSVNRQVFISTDLPSTVRESFSAPNGTEPPALQPTLDPAAEPVVAEPTKKAKTTKAKPSTAYVNPTTGVSSNDIKAAYLACLEDSEPGASVNMAETATWAKSIAEKGNLPDQVTTTYWTLKADPFWRKKHLSLATLAKQIGAVAGNGKTAQSNSPRHRIKKF